MREFSQKGWAGTALLTVSVAFLVSTAAFSTPSYISVTTIPVSGVNGLKSASLQLWLDFRLNDSLQTAMWGIGEWSFVLPEESELYSQFQKLAPGNARLTLTDSAGKVIFSRDLETPLARLESWKTRPDTTHLLLLTQDYSIGVGSYRGLVTTLVRVSDSIIEDVKALDISSHKEEPIQLVKAGKSDWLQSSDSEFLSVSCHPKSWGSNDSTFVTEYTRYSYDGLRWLKATKIKEGHWETGDTFPDRSAFP
ncbi:MAG: hypothetical protein WAU88_00685 [Candidatus Zixiibacteriota bacterium]